MDSSSEHLKNVQEHIPIENSKEMDDENISAEDLDKRLNTVQTNVDSKKTLFIATKESSEKVDLYVNYLCK